MGKHNRLTVLYEIDKALTNYCHVCPYFGHNTPHKNCAACPVQVELQKCGERLGWQEEKSKPKGHIRWSEEDDYVLRNHFGKMPVKHIATKLGRSYVSVAKRITRLREKGIL